MDLKHIQPFVTLHDHTCKLVFPSSGAEAFAIRQLAEADAKEVLARRSQRKIAKQSSGAGWASEYLSFVVVSQSLIIRIWSLIGHWTLGFNDQWDGCR